MPMQFPLRSSTSSSPQLQVGDRAAQVTTKAGSRLNVIHFPFITTTGNKLQMCAVIKGKTVRSLTKITKNASPVVQCVRLYY